MDLPPAVFLMGPTASGKTDLAISLRKKLPVDIISVDSTLVYRGLDIGSAKPSAAELALAPHCLIDIRDPAQPYSAAEFCTDAMREMRSIAAAGRIPLLVGGTMLYFKALLEGLAPMPGADGAVRAAIEAEAERHGWPYMHRQLAAVDADSAARIHPNHSRRLSRALEIYRVTGKTMTQLHREQAAAGWSLQQEFAVTQLALLPRDRATLHRRIAVRFEKMLEQGLVEEVTALYHRGDLHADLPAIRAVGYRQVWAFLAAELTRTEMVAQGQAATRQLAKRQLTWLRTWQGLQRIYTDDGHGNLLKSDEILAQALNFMPGTAI
ncbi:tRNA (adenosine(37)-N6)-dimethylallyltransferase MiaA [Exilibacterium tricleocarpae]|uniref:tRNA dimethylallyltransferase n=1 Tax=Exilibacterium tricleocarpae TaxID=2591008 RepID=A0A545T5X6_9GAMM|nr:tRNA (adenosine(37)-N6)-dimethylallyltransferase MiaA [Exilibacterium tricleocarpae]TQV72636.1 tRNA (adenosine(37)-N6)-dimethylallyltransferase MiaA [Exilibacterium tricleocarpae]